MPKSSLVSHLQADKADEASAIKGYGRRKKEAHGTGITSTLSEIQGDEKDHHRQLAIAIKGLKYAPPK